MTAIATDKSRSLYGLSAAWTGLFSSGRKRFRGAWRFDNGDRHRDLQGPDQGCNPTKESPAEQQIQPEYGGHLTVFAVRRDDRGREIYGRPDDEPRNENHSCRIGIDTRSSETLSARGQYDCESECITKAAHGRPLISVSCSRIEADPLGMCNPKNQILTRAARSSGLTALNRSLNHGGRA